ncbi:hypothetical protein [Undibacterium sp. YM2]|uniref:hypothetical protein n=1 Tax=Undibacterium sp. YM2 TaxID=2058625 RepID=UPI00138A3D04|nr:hypothetical protein [Undibacterium sp. YM2]
MMRRLNSLFAVCAGMAAALTIHSEPASAMTMLRSNDNLILYGKVVPEDAQRFRRNLSGGEVHTVVLTESPGGDLGAAYAIAKLIKDKKINTAVQGNCFSSCAVMFMAGTERRMLANKNLARTRLGFHGPHNKLTLEVSTEGIPKLREWLLNATDGKFPEALLDQAMYINNAGDMMYFYYPGANKNNNIRFCKAGTIAYPKLCETVTGHDVVSVGILTTAELLKVEELDQQAAGGKENPVATENLKQ